MIARPPRSKRPDTLLSYAPLFRLPRGGRRRSFHNPLSGCHRLQAVSHQDVVGEGKPAQDGVDLGLAAHGEPGEAPLAEARVDRKSTRLNSSNQCASRMPSYARKQKTQTKNHK